MTDNATGTSSAAVRFSSADQMIEPQSSMERVETAAERVAGPVQRDSITEESQQELRNLAISLQKSKIQASRMENFAYDPVSLPASRVHSHSSQIQAQAGPESPRLSPPISAMHSPPLTPSASGSKEYHKPSIGSSNLRPEPTPITPTVSPPHEAPPTSIPPQQPQQQVAQESRPSAAAQARLPRSSQARPKSMVDASGAVPSHPRHLANQVIGATGDSLPVSQEGSPTATPASGTPAGGESPRNRPYTPPAGDRNDQYARAKRPTQLKNLEGLEHRFVFGGVKPRPQSPVTPVEPAPVRPNGVDSVGKPENKKHSIFGAGKPDHHQHGSMSDLKRFFKFGGGHKKEKRERSPAPSKTGRTGTLTPPSRASSVALPFAEDHGLESKYGKFGKVLGAGAGGSVRIMKRQSDGTVFAVKQFRERHSYESEKEYNKKVTAEFCVGSTLHHGNIIETMDIVYEKGRWYEVMEYAPYDLFAIVMTGKMTREEVACCTLQILSGVVYIHSMGLAHRDLKLDNVVVNHQGIMKIIDFGSAAVFRYPFENDIVLATGIVGSDPYLAPEVYDLPKYDPRPTDVWSLAIIFCCMTLRRFPWKAPRISDNSYKLFVTEPTDEERRMSGYPSVPQSEPASRQASEVNDDDSASTRNRHHHHHHREQRGKSNDETARSEPATRENGQGPSSAASSSPSQAQTIKGPWRLLRLLPRETRNIIGRMLELDPKKRATLDDIQADPWVQKTAQCHQEDGCRIINIEGHTHTLEPSNSTPTAADGKKK